MDRLTLQEIRDSPDLPNPTQVTLMIDGTDVKSLDTDGCGPAPLPAYCASTRMLYIEESMLDRRSDGTTHLPEDVTYAIYDEVFAT